MRLIKQIKQNLATSNFSRHKKTYCKPKLLAQILVCLLAVNYTATATATPAPKDCVLLGAPTQHETDISELHYIVNAGISGLSNATDLKEGKVTIDPEKLNIDDTKSLTLTYVNSDYQHVNGNPVYEYISNHKDGKTIGENSSIYFGLTPALYSTSMPCLARLDYASTAGTHPALTLDLAYLQDPQNKILNPKNTLESIVICSKLEGTGGTKSKINSHALKVTGESTVTLTDGLIIANGAELDGGSGSAGLFLDEGSLTADIHNYGYIHGPAGVKIGDGQANDFWLKSPHGGAAKFHNHGKIEGEPATTGDAFVINETSIGNDANALELTNCKCEHGAGEITGNIKLGAKNTVDFTVINENVITGNLTKDDKDTGQFNVINHHQITTTVPAAATDNLHAITNYTGKAGSALTFKFAKLTAAPEKPLIHCGKDFTLENYSSIELQATAAFTPAKSYKVIIAEASGSIKLAQDIEDVVFTPVIDVKQSYVNFIIEASAINVIGSRIEAASLTAVAIPAKLLTDKNYMPNMVRVVNAYQNIINASNTAGKIAKAIDKDKVEIAGVSNADIKKLVDTNNKIPMFEIAKTYANSADEFFDILLPDSSNSQLIANQKVANKLIGQVTARIAGKSMVIAKARVNKIFADRGITSGEIANNISAWTSFNYIMSKTKANSDKQSYNKLNAMVFSLGADTQLAYRDITLGASYGFASSANKTYGGSSSKNSNNITPDEDIKTHAFTMYSAMNIDKVDAHVSMSLGFSKHDVKNQPEEKYNSRIIGLHSSVTYPLDVEYVNLDISGSVGFNMIHTDEHDNKYGSKDSEEDHNLVRLGLMVAITDVIDLNKDLSLDYKVGLGGKYTISSDKKSKIDVASGTTIDYKKRPVSPYDFNIDANLNMQVQQNMHVGLDLNFGMGKDSLDCGISTSFRYLF